MNRVTIFLVLTILGTSSCAMKVKGLEPIKDGNVDFNVNSDIPDEIEVNGDIGVDYRDAALFCDERYEVEDAEKGTDKADQCFWAILNYYDIEVGFNFDSVFKFCEDNYETKEEIATCQSNIFGSLQFANQGG